MIYSSNDRVAGWEDMTPRERVVYLTKATGVLPCIKLRERDDYLAYAQAMHDGGARVIEITMTSPDALAAIGRISEAFSDQLYVAAGTVLDVTTAREVILAGGRLIVSPVILPEVIDLAHRYGAACVHRHRVPEGHAGRRRHGQDLPRPTGWAQVHDQPAYGLPRRQPHPVRRNQRDQRSGVHTLRRPRRVGGAHLHESGDDRPGRFRLDHQPGVALCRDCAPGQGRPPGFAVKRCYGHQSQLPRLSPVWSCTRIERTATTMYGAAEIRQGIIEACLLCCRMGYFVGTWGNISVRYRDRFLITPTRLDYDAMTPADIVLIETESGRRAGGWRLPSSEMQLHRAIYRARPDVGAVVHSHSPHASAVSCLRKGIPVLLEDMAQLIGEVRCAPYVRGGMHHALAEGAVAHLGESNAVLLSNHGPVCCGRDLEEALVVSQVLEKSAQVFLLASSVTCGVHTIPAEHAVEERHRYLHRYGTVEDAAP